MSKRCDALIIGGGHNGLTCAFYRARAGLSVRILEAHHLVGGAALTEAFHPGFRNSTASYTVSLLQPRVIADMKLADHGYRVLDDSPLRAASGVSRFSACGRWDRCLLEPGAGNRYLQARRDLAID